MTRKPPIRRVPRPQEKPNPRLDKKLEEYLREQGVPKK
jgi:hypothetical protein